MFPSEEPLNQNCAQKRARRDRRDRDGCSLKWRAARKRAGKSLLRYTNYEIYLIKSPSFLRILSLLSHTHRDVTYARRTEQEEREK